MHAEDEDRQVLIDRTRQDSRWAHQVETVVSLLFYKFQIVVC